MPFLGVGPNVEAGQATSLLSLPRGRLVFVGVVLGPDPPRARGLPRAAGWSICSVPSPEEWVPGG